MRLIDADVLLDNIRCDSKKAIDEGDKVGSFWLGYAAGLVIKQPTIQSALDPETLIRTIETGITATNSSDAYSLGMRNGMRWCKSLIDGVEPKFEEMSVDNGKDLPSIQPEPQWIPVSERLPETGGESFFDGMVLITLRDKETGDLYVLNDKYCGDGDWLMCVPDEPTEVIAWMPLPEPYKPNKKQSGKEGA